MESNTQFIDKCLNVQIELSSNCNSLCLGCVRVDSTFNNVNPNIPKNSFLSLEIVEKLFRSEEMKYVENIEFCGTVDEPLVHPKFIEILELLHSINPYYGIDIHTNGSLRTKEFWKKLALTLNKFKDGYKLKFSIDGLRENHEFYRQGTNFNKIIKNAQTFIDNGGKAHWQFIEFDWNKDDTLHAQELSDKMGFKSFTKRIDRKLSKHTKPDIIKMKKVNDNNLVKNKRNNIDNHCIKCVTKQKKQYFISFDGCIWPCCFLRSGELSLHKSTREELYYRLQGNYGDNFNSLYYHNVSEILESDFFTKDLVNSWGNPIGIGRKNKLQRCYDSCNNERLTQFPVGKHTTLNNISLR